MNASVRSTRFWRTLLVALCLLSAAINAWSLFPDNIEASTALGYQAALTPDPAFVRVNSVDAGGAAERSGLRAGDLIHIREMTSGQRYRIITGVHPHEQIPVTLTRGSQTLHVLFRAGEKPSWRWDTWIWAAASFWLLAFAFAIAMRRPDSREARILCVILLLQVWTGLLPGSWLTPSPFADLIAAMVGCTSAMMWAGLLTSYASLFGRPISRARTALTVLTWTAASAIAIYEVVRLAMLWNGGKAWVAQSLAPDWNCWWIGIPYALALACAIAGVRDAQGKERARIAWTILSIAPLYVFQVITFAVPSLFAEAARGTGLIVAYELINVGSFLAPVGMTYALLNRRLLDVGFTLNRVAIFSVVSFIIVGAFVLVEFALGTWLQKLSHTASLVVGAVVALALGLSIHFVHGRVEHVLDRVFFRKRHEDEQAIRRFARESAYITDVQTLIARTVAVLEQHADASSVRLALDDGAGCYGGVSENDPAIVSLRTWHRAVDLHGVETQLQGEYAYPMVARGRLVGALVLGPKTTEETYAPDESQAIEELAHGVAGALDVLAQKRGAADDGLVQELRAMQAAIADGFAAINARLETRSRGAEV